MIDKIIQFFFGILFFVAPLIMSKSTSELFEFNKMIFIYGSTVIIVFLWLYKMIATRKIILKKTPLDIPIIIFFVSQVISTLFSIDRHVSIFGYYGRFNGGLLSIMCYILLYYALVSNKNDIEKLLKSIMASSLIVILWAIPGHFGHDLTCLLFTGKFDNSCWDNSTLAFRPELRAFSTLGQPNWLGAYLAVVFFIGIYLLIKNRSNIKYLVLNSLYLFLNFSMLLFTRSRSAILSIFIGLVLFLVYYLLFIKLSFKKILIILLIVTVVPILFFKTGEDKIDKYLKFPITKFQETNKSPIINNQPSTTSSNVTESFDIRTIVWEGALTLAKHYPLFGTGVETFAYSYNFVRPVSHNLTSEWDYVYNKAHNEYFNYLATTGFVGLGAYLIFIGVFAFYIARKIKYQKLNIKTTDQKSKILKNSNALSTNFNSEILTLSLFCGWLTILITNFFGFSTTTTQLFFYLIPAMIFLRFTKNDDITYFGKLNGYQWLAISAVTTYAIYILFSLGVYYYADVDYSYGLKYVKVNDQQRAAGFFEKALKLRSEPVYMDRFSSSLAYLSALASVQKETEIAGEIASLSDTYNRKLIQDYPKNVFYWKTRAKNMYYFFQITGKQNELEQGISALKNAQKLSPTDPKIPYSLALYNSVLYDLSKNDQEKQNLLKLSIDEINEVIRLKSNYREGYILKGQLLKKYGFSSEAKSTFEYILKNFDKNDAESLKELQSM